ncbi:peptidoglycan-binding protein [Pelomyxa schiedti]|nr:peptidoglycan-binding protein [Pelomyxa schiedti]
MRAPVLLVVCLCVAAVVGQTCSSQTCGQTKLTDSQARTKITGAGISISSSGGCTDRYKSTCTSLEQVNKCTQDDIITLKSSSGCAITITGGTETGHASGTFSHWNGYKLDISYTSCITNYITSSFTKVDSTHWESKAGNIYYNESNHWDICYCS